MTWRALFSYIASKVFKFWAPKIIIGLTSRTWIWMKFQSLLLKSSIFLNYKKYSYLYFNLFAISCLLGSFHQYEGHDLSRRLLNFASSCFQEYVFWFSLWCTKNPKIAKVSLQYFVKNFEYMIFERLHISTFKLIWGVQDFFNMRMAYQIEEQRTKVGISKISPYLEPPSSLYAHLQKQYVYMLKKQF